MLNYENYSWLIALHGCICAIFAFVIYLCNIASFFVHICIWILFVQYCVFFKSAANWSSIKREPHCIIAAGLDFLKASQIWSLSFPPHQQIKFQVSNIVDIYCLKSFQTWFLSFSQPPNILYKYFALQYRSFFPLFCFFYKNFWFSCCFPEKRKSWRWNKTFKVGLLQACSGTNWITIKTKLYPFSPKKDLFCARGEGIYVKYLANGSGGALKHLF